MALLPLPFIRHSIMASKWALAAVATGLAYTSSTAVTGLMGAAAGCCDEDDDRSSTTTQQTQETLARGKSLGSFRSKGQLGRAIGPLLVTACYWTRGPTWTYSVVAIALGVLAWSMSSLVTDELKRKMSNKTK